MVWITWYTTIIRNYRSGAQALHYTEALEMITEDKKTIFNQNLALINNTEFMASVEKLFNGDITNIGCDCVSIRVEGWNSSKLAMVYKADIHMKGWVNALIQIGNWLHVDFLLKEYLEINRSQFFHEVERLFVTKYGMKNKKQWDKFIKENQEEIYLTIEKASQAAQEIQSISNKVRHECWVWL